MWIFTNGVNSGVANLIGNAVKNETLKMRIKRSLKSRNLTNLIGVVTEDAVRYGELIAVSDKVFIKFKINSELCFSYLSLTSCCISGTYKH